MKAEDSSRLEVWFAYIGRLNDRALNRQRASGFTTWAVAGVVAILFVKALAHLPTITTNREAAFAHLMAVTGSVNLLFFGGMLLMLLSCMGTVSTEARLKSRLDRSSMPIVFSVLWVLFLTFGVANISMALIAPIQLYRWPFWVLGVFFALNVLGYPASRIRSLVKHRKHFRDLQDLSTPPFITSAKHRIAFCAVTLLLAVLGVCIAAVPAVQALPLITTSSHVDTLTWSMCVAGVIFLGVFLCFRIAAHRYDIFLGQLERRIILESLAPDVIRTEFVREFIGEDVREWLAGAEANLKRLHDDFVQAASKAEEQFAELAKINRNMHFEITGRKKVICQELQTVVERYIEYAEKLQQQIEHLSDQRAPVACPDLFKQVLMDWKLQLKSIKSRHQAVCAVCAKASSEQEKAEPCTPEVRPPATGGRP